MWKEKLMAKDVKTNVQKGMFAQRKKWGKLQELFARFVVKWANIAEKKNGSPW